MSREYSIADAKDHLPEAVRAAETGESVTFTRRGRPVAVLLSVARYHDLQAARPDFWEVAEGIRRAAQQDGVEFLEADFAGLRDPAPGRDVKLLMPRFLLDTNVLSQVMLPLGDRGILDRSKKNDHARCAVPILSSTSSMYGCERLAPGARRTRLEDFVREAVCGALPCAAVRRTRGGCGTAASERGLSASAAHRRRRTGRSPRSRPSTTSRW